MNRTTRESRGMCLKGGLIVCLITLATAWTALGQPQPIQTGSIPISSSPAKISINFPGGSPEDLVALLRNTGAKVNVLISPEAKRAVLPPISLRDVSVDDIFESLDTLARVNPTGVRVTFKPTSDGRNIWILAPVTRPLPREAQVYYLGKHLHQYTVDDITTMIHTACSMAELGEARLKFHPGTHSLIAMGDRMQLQIINNVLEQLAKGLDDNAPQAKQETGQKVQLPGNPTVLHVFNLSALLPFYSAQDVINTIRSAWATADFADEARISFDERSSTLIISGGKDQLAVVGELLEQLTEAEYRKKAAATVGDAKLVAPAK